MKAYSLFLLSLLAAFMTGCSSDGGWRNLLDDDLSQWRIYQSYALTNDFVPYHRPTDSLGNEIPPIGYDVNLDDEFRVEELGGEKVLHVSGEYYGCAFTKESYGNYHLRLKVKFGENKFEPRLDKVKDSGMLYHSIGECGNDGWVTWMRSHEFQILEHASMEGSTGDYYTVLGTHMDIRSNPRMESPAWSMYSYSPDAPLRTVGAAGGGATCQGPDVSDPSAEWISVELICFEDKAIHIVDGNVKMALENSAYWDGEKDIPLTEGKIQLRSQAAEVYYKDIEIRPIKAIPDEYSYLFEDKQLRPRTIVTTDGEVDDMDSFVRLLAYSNDLDIEGIVYTSSQWHWKGDGKGTLRKARMGGEVESFRWLGTEWIQEMIDRYEVSYPNLKSNDPDYPTPEYLRSILKVENVDFEGDMEKDTEGSNLIKDILLDGRPGPLYIQVWGGSNTLARALLTIEEEHSSDPDWQRLHREISSKVIMMMIQDQDPCYREYISQSWPGIKVVRNNMQFWSFAYGWSQGVPKELQKFLDGNWFNPNIKTGHGPLMERYYTWGEGYHLDDPQDHYGSPEDAERAGRMIGDFISEGDSPSFLALLDFGLRSQEDFSWGGVGGRFTKTADNLWQDPRENPDFNPYTGKKDNSYALIRWLEVLQNDFAARADWCVNPYKKANHRPEVSVEGSLNCFVRPGDTVHLEGRATDPDGDKVSFNWWNYVEAGSYPTEVVPSAPSSAETSFTVPADAKSGDTFHFILEVKDDGTPQLRHFARVVVKVV